MGIAMLKTFDYIQDPGHGWVKVPLAMLRDLGIAEQITYYSYMHKGHAYLEEDSDTATFFNAYRARYGHDPKLRDRIARERPSRVRGYDRYPMGAVKRYKQDHNWMQEVYNQRVIVDAKQ
jgi:hypothetical protein